MLIQPTGSPRSLAAQAKRLLSAPKSSNFCRAGREKESIMIPHKGRREKGGRGKGRGKSKAPFFWRQKSRGPPPGGKPCLLYTSREQHPFLRKIRRGRILSSDQGCGTGAGPGPCAAICFFEKDTGRRIDVYKRQVHEYLEDASKARMEALDASRRLAALQKEVDSLKERIGEV